MRLPRGKIILPCTRRFHGGHGASGSRSGRGELDGKFGPDVQISKGSRLVSLDPMTFQEKQPGSVADPWKDDDEVRLAGAHAMRRNAYRYRPKARLIAGNQPDLSSSAYRARLSLRSVWAQAAGSSSSPWEICSRSRLNSSMRERIAEKSSAARGRVTFPPEGDFGWASAHLCFLRLTGYCFVKVNWQILLVTQEPVPCAASNRAVTS